MEKGLPPRVMDPKVKGGWGFIIIYNERVRIVYILFNAFYLTHNTNTHVSASILRVIECLCYLLYESRAREIGNGVLVLSFYRQIKSFSNVHR